MNFPLPSQDPTYSLSIPTHSEWERGPTSPASPHYQLRRLRLLLPLPAFFFARRNGDTELIRGAEAQETDYQIHEPTVPWYDEPQMMNSSAFNELLFPMFIEPSNQVSTEDIPLGQPTPLPAHIPSSAAPNIPMGIPAVNTVTLASTIAPPTPATNVTNQGRFRCPLCPKTFDRVARAEACLNEHFDWKPHVCQGVCGDINCTAAYFSIENLHRHARVPAKRKVACPYCARSFLKQNISRHKKSCI